MKLSFNYLKITIIKNDLCISNPVEHNFGLGLEYLKVQNISKLVDGVVFFFLFCFFFCLQSASIILCPLKTNSLLILNLTFIAYNRMVGISFVASNKVTILAWEWGNVNCSFFFFVLIWILSVSPSLQHLCNYCSQYYIYLQKRNCFFF